MITGTRFGRKRNLERINRSALLPRRYRSILQPLTGAMTRGIPDRSDKQANRSASKGHSDRSDHASSSTSSGADAATVGLCSNSIPISSHLVAIRSRSANHVNCSQCETSLSS